MPALVGLPKALELILTGKNVRPKQALEDEFGDAVVPPSILLDVARQWVLGQKKQKRSWLQTFQKSLFRLSPIRAYVLIESRKQAAKKAGDHYPAIEKDHQAIAMHYDGGSKVGYGAEAQAFGELSQHRSQKHFGTSFCIDSIKKKTK